MIKIGELIYLKNRDEWHTWLKKNCNVKKEIWLIYYKKHTGKIRIPYDDAVEEALCFGWIDSIVKRIDNEKFAQKFTPRRDRSIWSELNKDRAERLIEAGLMTEAGMAKIREAKKNGEWYKMIVKKDSTDIPSDLQKALSADKNVLMIFTGLSPSYKKQYIRWINNARRDNTRKRRIMETVRLIRENKMLGMK